MTPGGLPFEVPMRPPEEQEPEAQLHDPASPGQARAAAAGREAEDVGPDPTGHGEEGVVPAEEAREEEETEGVEITRRAERSELSMGGAAAGHDVSLSSPFQAKTAAGFAGLMCAIFVEKFIVSL